MLSIRLSRMGKKKQPTYRVVVQEKSRDPQGRSVELLGFYNPRTEPKTINFKAERITYWLSKGAQCTDVVHNLLVDEKIVAGPKRKATKHEKDKNKDDEKRVEEKKPTDVTKKSDEPKTGATPAIDKVADQAPDKPVEEKSAVDLKEDQKDSATAQQ